MRFFPAFLHWRSVRRQRRISVGGRSRRVKYLSIHSATVRAVARLRGITLGTARIEVGYRAVARPFVEESLAVARPQRGPVVELRYQQRQIPKQATSGRRSTRP
jgi:hypothetical protein